MKNEETISPNENAKGKKELINYISALIQADEFKNEIKKIRSECAIPKDGYSFKNDNGRKRYTSASVFLAWELSLKYQLFPVEWADVFHNFILYNELLLPKEDHGGYSLCSINVERDDAGASDKKVFPIVIRISPYASENVIVDFIKKNYSKYIKPLQTEFVDSSSKIGRIRTRRKTGRDKFIYEHRHLPRRKITGLVHDKFNEHVDQGLVGKIISIQKNRRKKV